MKTDNGTVEGDTWPVPKFSFEVDFGNKLDNAFFQEVSGLEIESQVIEYRAGDSPVFSSIKIPGIKKFGNITLKKGMFVNGDGFLKWYQENSMNIINRRTMYIKLLDEAGNVTIQWVLQNAWITKITGTDLPSDESEATLDTVEIAHEGISVSNSL